MSSTSLLFILLWAVGSYGLEEDTVDEQAVIRYTCQCGYTKPVLTATRIIGTPVTVNEFSFMAGLMAYTNNKNNRSPMFCGATIITKWHALTTATCTKPYVATDLVLDVGDHDWTSTTETTAQVYVNITQKLEHPNYVSTSKLNDIALLTLATEIIFTAERGPVCFPATNPVLDGLQVKAMGWGAQKFNGTLNNTPNEADFTVLTTTACNTGLGSSFTYVYANQVCLKSITSTYGVCDLDYGYPVVILDDISKRYVLVGLPVFAVERQGKNCDTTKPSVATRVGAYLSWILSGIQNSGSPASSSTPCTRAA